MNKFFDFIQNSIVPPLAKLGEEKHLRGIRKGLVVTIPFVIVGSVFLIISSLPIPGWDKIVEPIVPKLNVMVSASFGMLSVIASLGVGYNLSIEYGIDPISGALLSFVTFLVTQVNENFEITTANFGSTGLFTALFSAVISVIIMNYFVKRKLVIKLPENVPPSISNSFVSLIPAAVTLTLFWIVRVILGFDFNNFFKLIFSPLVFALNTLPGIAVYIFFMCLLWTVGIHGDLVLGSIGGPIFLQYVTANSEAFLAHKPIPYITGQGFIDFFINIGGTGATFALVILMLRSKDEGYKSLAKVALPSAIFEINEPITFGFPITLNPVMMIPYIVTPFVLTVVTYLLMYFNIIGKPVLVVPWTTPPIISHFLVTGGDWRAALWGAISIVISGFIYLPFFKSSERATLESAKIEAKGKSVSLN